MTTPLMICAMLIIPALLGALLGRLRRREGGFFAGGAVGLAIAYGFFAVGHFAMTDGMIDMLPAFVPFRRELIWATGVWESVIAVGLSVGLVVAAREWAARPSPLLAPLAGAVYGVYILHVFLLVPIQSAFLGVALPVFAKFLAVTLLGLAISFAAAMAVRRLPGLRVVL